MAKPLSEQLHDEIDEIEVIAETARDRAEAVRSQIIEVARQAEDIRDIFEIAALLYEKDLDEQTSQAVRSGFEIARRR